MFKNMLQKLWLRIFSSTSEFECLAHESEQDQTPPQTPLATAIQWLENMRDDQEKGYLWVSMVYGEEIANEALNSLKTQNSAV